MNGFLRILSMGIGLSLLTAWILSNSAETQAPQRSRFAFTHGDGSNTDIHVMDMDGRNHLQITETGTEMAPAWSPDGKRIAFTSRRDGNLEVYVANADGRNARNLSRHPTRDYGAAWSPDGTKILFASRRDNDKSYYLYTMDPDGRNVRPVAPNQAGWDGCWSPDGRRIAFSRYIEGNERILTMNADGSNIQVLPPEGVDSLNPRWSPDGTRIVYASGGTAHQSKLEIWTMDPDGNNRRRLTDDNIPSWHPEWLPDGTRISFAQNVAEGKADTWLMDADGKNAKRFMEDVWEVSWFDPAFTRPVSPAGHSYVPWGWMKNSWK